jgi:hypothetical protein
MIGYLLSTWALIGLFVCYVIPPIEWQRNISRYLFIFITGPAVWTIWLVNMFLTWLAFKVIEKETGLKKDDWTEEL